MRPNPKFLHQDKQFWANVRTISQQLGYTLNQRVRVYSLEQIKLAMNLAGLSDNHLFDQADQPTTLAVLLKEYFDYRAEALNSYIEPRLMDVERARSLFYEYHDKLQPTNAIPMNKQSGTKKQPAFLTGLVNILIEANSTGLPCNYDPRILTTITKNNAPLRTLARRVDGCFPSCINPIAIWEIKEYYYTTTFGSRIADAIYETLLDGLELEKLREHEKIDVQHLVVIDAYATWWKMGKSYLCRLIDILNMGYVDEILFGYEVVERLPDIVKEWVDIYNDHNRA
jgi:hypothetical protein